MIRQTAALLLAALLPLGGDLSKVTATEYSHTPRLTNNRGTTALVALAASGVSTTVDIGNGFHQIMADGKVADGSLVLRHTASIHRLLAIFPAATEALEGLITERLADWHHQRFST